LPDPDSPVNHTVRPLDSRSSAHTSDWCRTVLGLAVLLAAGVVSRTMPAATVPLVSGSIRMNEPVAEFREYSSSSSGCCVRSVMRPSSLSFKAVADLSRCSVLTSSR
jgi:hypothetical protein